MNHNHFNRLVLYTIQQVLSQSNSKAAFPENVVTETSLDKNKTTENDTQQNNSSDKSAATAGSKDVQAPKQQELEKEINNLKNDLVELGRKRDMNIMTAEDCKEISKKKQMLKSVEKKLAARMKATERQRKHRLERKRAMDDLDPEIRKKLCRKEDGGRGRPRKPDSTAGGEEELLKTITEIAITGSASDDRRRTEMIRTVKTLDDLTHELQKRGYQLSRSSVYLRLLPRKSSSAEGKRHVKTAPVKLIRAQNSQHRNHPDTKFARSSIQAMEEIASLLGPEEVTFHSQVYI
jgi:hypothetical protein